MMDDLTLFPPEGPSMKPWQRNDPMSGPGQSRNGDPVASEIAASFVAARATSARVLLLKAHGANPDGLTDEDAARIAGVSLLSEYATRCSELMRMGLLADTDQHREGRAGAPRTVRCITALGVFALALREGAS